MASSPYFNNPGHRPFPNDRLFGLESFDRVNPDRASNRSHTEKQVGRDGYKRIDKKVLLIDINRQTREYDR